MPPDETIQFGNERGTRSVHCRPRNQPSADTKQVTRSIHFWLCSQQAPFPFSGTFASSSAQSWGQTDFIEMFQQCSFARGKKTGKKPSTKTAILLWANL